MISTIYNVITNYTVNNQASTPLNQIERAARGAAVAFGALFLAKTIWDQLVKGPQEIPSSVVTMASLINANQTYVDSAGQAVTAAQNFAHSQAEAKNIVEQMVQAAKGAAGGLGDFVGTGVDTLNAFSQAGGNLRKDFVDFQKEILTAASLLGVDYKQAGMDTMRMLTGGAGTHVRMFSALRPQIFALSKDLQALPIDKATEKFNQMASSDKLQILRQAFQQFSTPEALGAIGQLLPATLDTLGDNVEALRNAFGTAFSGRVVATLGRINDWFERNDTMITAAAQRWGDRLAWAFDKGVAAIEFLGRNATPILAVIGGAAAFNAGRFAA